MSNTLKLPLDDIHAWLTHWVTELGPSPFAQLRSGPPKASTTAPATGTLIREIALPVSPFTTPFNGSIGKSGVWTASTGGTGVIGHMLVVNNAKTVCRWVGKVSQAVAYALTADAGVNAFVLTVASTAGILPGSGVVGVGVRAGTIVADITATTITLNQGLLGAMFIDETIVVGDPSGDALISGAYVPETTTPVTIHAFNMGWPGLF